MACKTVLQRKMLKMKIALGTLKVDSRMFGLWIMFLEITKAVKIEAYTSQGYVDFDWISDGQQRKSSTEL